MLIPESIQSIQYLPNLLAFFSGIVAVIISIPPINRVAFASKLFNSRKGKKFHYEQLPPLGGVAVFIGFLFGTIINTYGLQLQSLKYIIASLTLMLFIGLQVDLKINSSVKTFAFQIFAILLLIFFGNIQITDLHGLFGIYKINYITSIIFSLVIILIIVNAFNVIECVDGLACGLTILSAFVLALWFYLSHNNQFAILAFALVGSLTGFLLFNIFKKKNKWRLGNSGSWVIGLVVSILLIQFNELNISNKSPFSINASPVVSLGIIIIPITDGMQFITLRLLKTISRLDVDKNLIYFEWIKLFRTHHNASLILISINVLIIIIALFLNYTYYEITLQFLLIFSLGLLRSFLPFHIAYRKESGETRNY